MSDPGNRRARLSTAAGSAAETRHALRQAVAWRLVSAGKIGSHRRRAVESAIALPRAPRAPCATWSSPKRQAP
jgi:hypothetical protein